MNVHTPTAEEPFFISTIRTNQLQDDQQSMQFPNGAIALNIGHWQSLLFFGVTNTVDLKPFATTATVIGHRGADGRLVADQIHMSPH